MLLDGIPYTNGRVSFRWQQREVSHFFFCVEEKSSMYSPDLQIIETMRAGFWKYDDISEVSLQRLHLVCYLLLCSWSEPPPPALLYPFFAYYPNPCPTGKTQMLLLMCSLLPPNLLSLLTDSLSHFERGQNSTDSNI